MPKPSINKPTSLSTKHSTSAASDVALHTSIDNVAAPQIGTSERAIKQPPERSRSPKVGTANTQSAPRAQQSVSSVLREDYKMNRNYL
jgi:hypothetical protein